MKQATADPTARWFNEGCDARLAGYHEADCPYEGNGTARLYWMMGWRDVHRNYAVLVETRWSFRSLRPLLE